MNNLKSLKKQFESQLQKQTSFYPKTNVEKTDVNPNVDDVDPTPVLLEQAKKDIKQYSDRTKKLIQECAELIEKSERITPVSSSYSFLSHMLISNTSNIYVKSHKIRNDQSRLLRETQFIEERISDIEHWYKIFFRFYMLFFIFFAFCMLSQGFSVKRLVVLGFLFSFPFIHIVRIIKKIIAYFSQ